MENFDIASVQDTLRKCGNLTREALRERLRAIPKAPDLVLFTPSQACAAWALGTTDATLSVADIAALETFWAAAARLTGQALPDAGARVNAAAVLVRATGVLPCAAAIPAEVYAAAVKRARLLLKRDFPPLADAETCLDFVLFWDLRTDALRVSLR